MNDITLRKRRIPPALLATAGCLLGLSVLFFLEIYPRITGAADDRAIVMPDLDAINAAAGGDERKAANLIETLLKTALELEHVQPGGHVFLAGYSPALSPLTERGESTLHPAGYPEYAVLLITCLDEPVRFLADASEKTRFWGYRFAARVDQVIGSSVTWPTEFVMESGLHNDDGTVPFEAGKQYLVFVTIEASDDNEDGFSLDFINNNPFRITNNDIGYITVNPEMGMIPWAPVTTTFQQMQNEGHAGLLSLLAFYEERSSSVPVYATDSMDSVVSFYQKTTIISEGRPFSDWESESGARVCIISEELAERNGLSAGDKIALRFSHALYEPLEQGEGYRPYMLPWFDFSDGGDYVVTGLYRPSKEPLPGCGHAPDTVFIPRSSIPDLRGRDVIPVSPEGVPPEAFVLTLPRERLGDFVKAMDALGEGYGSLFAR